MTLLDILKKREPRPLFCHAHLGRFISFEKIGRRRYVGFQTIFLHALKVPRAMRLHMYRYDSEWTGYRRRCNLSPSIFLCPQCSRPEQGPSKP